MDRLKPIGWKRNKEYENAPTAGLRRSFCDELICCGGLSFPPPDILNGGRKTLSGSGNPMLVHHANEVRATLGVKPVR